MENKQEYALLLLSKTNLTYSQISDLTGFSLSQISTWAQTSRPKEVRDQNILSGITPDIQKELLKLRDCINSKTGEATTQDVVDNDSIIRELSYAYKVQATKPLAKQILLDELNALEKQIMGINSDSIKLHLSIEGV